MLVQVELYPNQKMARNLVRLRNLAGLTQEQLAERADISRGFLLHIERGTKNPSFNVTTRLKRGLRCEWNELLRGVE